MTTQQYFTVHTFFKSRSTGERPFSCSDCPAMFSRKTHLKVHQLSHSNLKPFACATCGRRFARKHHLVDHANTHLQDHTATPHSPPHQLKQLFYCSQCAKGFSRKSSLQRHSLTCGAKGRESFQPPQLHQYKALDLHERMDRVDENDVLGNLKLLAEHSAKNNLTSRND